MLVLFYNSTHILHYNFKITNDFLIWTPDVLCVLIEGSSLAYQQDRTEFCTTRILRLFLYIDKDI